MHKKKILLFLLLSIILMGCNVIHNDSSSTNNSAELSTSIESSSSESSSEISSQEPSYDDNLRVAALAKAANHQIAEDYDVATTPKNYGITDTSGKYVKNIDTSGMVYDTNGNPLAYNVCSSDLTVYYGAAYISLEAVAAYIYAFGELPVNYDYSSYRDDVYDDWGQYGRLYGSKVYSNDVSKYPGEPELPGGTTQYNYRECDIGSSSYYGGKDYNRGVYRICWTTDQEPGDDRYVFYSTNHYCAFQEYLNYEGGWGQRFGFKYQSLSYDTNPSITTYPDIVKSNIS